MKREYHRWWSSELGRDMEMLIFGHDGVPAIVFPTSSAPFHEFEDRGMVAAVADKIDAGRLQVFCVDSVDRESWYNRHVGPRWRIARQVQYDRYIVHEAVPFAKGHNWRTEFLAVGCSFGGFHAVNMGLKHPDVFRMCLSMSGAFDLTGLGFLQGYYDFDVYTNQPLAYMANLQDEWFLWRLRQNRIVLATGVHDQCWNDNERLAQVIRSKGLPVQLDVWGDNTGHDWPYWQRMLQTYL